MALGTYAELQTAIQTELDSTETGLVAAIPDLIKRCEVKLNRRLRLREMEQLAYATYASGTTAFADRLLAVPNTYVEILSLDIKPATANDDAYAPAQYVTPRRISEYYTSSVSGPMYYTLRDQLEFSRPVGADHLVLMHYIKRWDIAGDSTNWLLTNYPDVYLYGSLVEASLFIRNKEAVLPWASAYAAAVEDLNALSERGRDDGELDVSEVASMSSGSSYNILVG